MKTFERQDLRVREVAEAIWEDGIVKVRDWLSPDTISFLKRILAEGECLKSKAHPFIPNAKQIFVSIDSIRKSEELDALVVAFTEIGSEYIGKGSVDYAFLSAFPPVNQGTDVLPWHFDRVQTLKAYFYLEDCYEGDGAFEYGLGSHHFGRTMANESLARGIAQKTVANDISETLVREPILCEGAAGTGYIFDTDGFHRGGYLKEGRNRMICRLDFYRKGTRMYGDRMFSSGWMQRFFNINHFLGQNVYHVTAYKGGQIAQTRDKTIEKSSK